MIKHSHDDLLYILNFFNKKREDLVSPFLKKDYEWIGKSFKYERDQAAFDLVREMFVTLWIDNHIVQLLKEGVSEYVKNKAMELLSEILNTSNSELDDTKIKHLLLEKRITCLKNFLDIEDANNQKINELKYSYEKDKAMFEREFSKYEKETTT